MITPLSPYLIGGAIAALVALFGYLKFVASRLSNERRENAALKTSLEVEGKTNKVEASREKATTSLEDYRAKKAKYDALNPRKP